MDFMKRHRLKLVLLGVFVLTFIIALFALISLLYPDAKKDVYGNRLEGINKVKISNQIITEIKDKLASSELVGEVEYVLKGRLINFDIKAKDSIDINTLKELVDKIPESFSKKQLNYYDIQVCIIMPGENDETSVFAYMHKSSDKFVWTNN